MAYKTCCIDSCTYSHSDKKYFRFPLNNVPLLNAWLKAMDYSLIDITDNTYLCSAHFKNDDFICENGSYDLSPTAVPSKFKFKVPKLNEGASTSNTYDNNRSINRTNASKSTVNASTAFGKDYRVNLLPNSIKSNPSRNISNEIDDQGVSHQIFPTSRMNNHKNDIRPRMSMPTYSQRNSINKSQPQVGNPFSIGNPISYEDTDPDSDESEYWMPMKSEFKHIIPDKYSKRMRLLLLLIKRLSSKCQSTDSEKMSMLDTKLELLEIKKDILVTQELLIIYGIDTSNYPIFTKSYNSDSSFNDSGTSNIGYDMSL